MLIHDLREAHTPQNYRQTLTAERDGLTTDPTMRIWRQSDLPWLEAAGVRAPF